MDAMTRPGTETIPHARLSETAAGVVGEGGTSKAFHLDDVPELGSVHDSRRKRVLFNGHNTGSPLLVDVVTIAPGDASPLHYHRGTEHFFFILDGIGRIRIKEQDYPLRRGSAVWIADSDVHQIFAGAESPLTFLEYFSRGRHETIFLGQACEWRPATGSRQANL